MLSVKRPVGVVGNWKMMKTAEETRIFVRDLAQRLLNVPAEGRPQMVICPPFTALDIFHRTRLETGLPVSIGAQNIAPYADEGAVTGEIAPRMLAEFDVNHVLVGHSERRTLFNETDETVNRKIGVTLKHKMTPIVCVGESFEQRDAGKTDAWIRGQVDAALYGQSLEDRQRMVMAYEPIWAIGTGNVCSAEEANRVIGLIREQVGVPQIPVLYGGSVKPENTTSLMAQPEIDGLLVGGASLDADSFSRILEAATPVSVS
jgi:triosephosphate isomerase